MTSKEKITYTGNAWNVKSALDLELAGFDIIGTSSAAIASSFGFEDGEKIPFELLFTVVELIGNYVRIPISVDIERGYADTIDNLLSNVSRLLESGCKGINIEDVDVADENVLINPELFANKILSLKKEFGSDLYINSRTDTYLKGVEKAKASTIARIKIYQDAGTDGVFIPGLTKEDAIEEIVKNAKVPINLMALPKLPNISRLESIGIKRISFGNFGYEKTYDYHRLIMDEVLNTGNFSKLF